MVIILLAVVIVLVVALLKDLNVPWSNFTRSGEMLFVYLFYVDMYVNRKCNPSLHFYILYSRIVDLQGSHKGDPYSFNGIEEWTLHFAKSSQVLLSIIQILIQQVTNIICKFIGHGLCYASC